MEKRREEEKHPPYAHTPNDKGEWHLLVDHLRGVARRAREFGDKFGAGDWAELAGWWHNLEGRKYYSWEERHCTRLPAIVE